MHVARFEADDDIIPLRSCIRRKPPKPEVRAETLPRPKSIAKPAQVSRSAYWRAAPAVMPLVEPLKFSSDEP